MGINEIDEEKYVIERKKEKKRRIDITTGEKDMDRITKQGKKTT